jgi:hypothetical protein
MQRFLFFTGHEGMNRILFPLLAFCLLFFSCEKQEENRYDCGPTPMCADIRCVAFWSNLNFSVVDKTTGKDLIFGSNPTLTPADVKLFVKSNSPYRQVPTFADSSSGIMRTMTASDTMAIQIKNEPLQYIVVKTFCRNECCSRTAVELVHEGQLLIADKNKVFRIKR